MTDETTELERLRAENAKLRQTLSHLLRFARGNPHVLGIIHDALDARYERREG